MKKFVLGMFAACLLAACGQSNQSGAAGTVMTAENAPVMKFDKDYYDFGKIKSGDKVNYKYTFVNTGKSPLIITDAHATCGCTIPQWPHEPIKPGDKGAIDVTFSSIGKKGRQDKQINITANTVPNQNIVHLVGEVLDKQ